MGKKSLALILLVIAAAFALGACGGEDRSSKKGSPHTTQTGQENREAAAPQNAAVHYNKAFELMKFNAKTHPDARSATLVMMQGWERIGTPELEKALEEDRGCFAEFKKALDLKRCDFTFGKQQFLHRSGDPARTQKIWSMTCLNLLNARYAEHKGRPLDAVEACLDEIRFMRHVAQGKPFMNKVTALNLEERTLVALRNMLQKKKLDRESRNRLVAGLESLEKDRFPAAAIFEGEKEYSLFVVDAVARALVEGGTSKPSEEDQTGPFCEKLAVAGREAADRYFGLVSKAHASGSDDDWKAVTDEMALLKKGGRESRDKMRTTDDLVAYVRGEMETGGVDAATRAAQSILGLYTCDAKGMIKNYEKIVGLMNQIKQTAMSD